MRPLYSATMVLMMTCAVIGDDKPATQPKTTTFTGGTEYVEVPVIVQRSNKHVPGLAKTDFTVQQDSKDVTIATFDEVHAIGGTKGRSGGASFNNSLAFTSSQTPPQVVLLALDTVSTPPLDQAYFKEELKKYLSGSRPEDPPMGLVELTRNGMHVLHDFTRDHTGLLAEIQRLKSLPQKNDEQSKMLAELYNEAQQMAAEGGPDDAAAADAARREADTQRMQQAEDAMTRFQDNSVRIDSLYSLQQIAQSLKGIPGRKTLLWAGSGFPFMTGTTTNGQAGRTFMPDHIGDTLDAHAYTWKLLNDANVAVYPIDLRRTSNPAFAVMDTSFKYSPTATQKDQAWENDSEVTTTFQVLAAQTGGKPCIFRTDLHNCIREAADDNRDYYLLGFYVDKNNKSPGWHKISVKLNNQKATLRYREGFLITKPKSDDMKNTDLQLALNSPFAYTSLPFSGRFVGTTPQGDKKDVNFELRIPPDAISLTDSKINLDILAVVRAPGGKEAARISQHIEKPLRPENVTTIRSEGINYSNKLAVPTGDYGVWFVLRDNPTGRTGSVTVPLKVQ
jgi:VWFA-related protein